MAPKSEAGKRVVPIIEPLRAFLADRLIDGMLEGEQLVFGRTPTDPFSPPTVMRRARKAWAKVGLEPVTLHTARHTFASFLIDADIPNVKAVTDAMGHSSATVTWDTYGHLFPNARDQLRSSLNGYFEGMEADRAGANPGANPSEAPGLSAIGGKDERGN